MPWAALRRSFFLLPSPFRRQHTHFWLGPSYALSGQAICSGLEARPVWNGLRVLQRCLCFGYPQGCAVVASLQEVVMVELCPTPHCPQLCPGLLSLFILMD